METIQLGHVREIVRYPIKSMAGIASESAFLGWHGFEGDRRFAFRRLDADGGFPWLTASRLHELVLYQPLGFDENPSALIPTHVRTPAGSRLELRSATLAEEISKRYGGEVELLNLKHGIFDEAAVSVISLATIAGIGREAGLELDRRRFRANIFVETDGAEPFLENEWVAGTLRFGENDSPPAVKVTMCDERCVMINLDPETAEKDPRIMKTVARLNQNNAGVYATVVHCGTIKVGDRVSLTPEQVTIE